MQNKAFTTPDSKHKQGAEIRSMFDGIAARYNIMNRVMTMGMDMRWRRFVVEKAMPEQAGKMLDLASGTGDIAFEILRKDPQQTVVAGDFSVGMLAEGKKKDPQGNIQWIACDAMHLPFPDNTFDAVTFGYLLRNVVDVDRTLQEIARVLKPGGHAVCLDTTPPPPSMLRPLIRAYLKVGLPILASMFAKHKGAYDYLGGSTLAFQTPDELKARFEKNGFELVRYKTFMLNTIAIHWATAKPTQQTP